MNQTLDHDSIVPGSERSEQRSGRLLAAGGIFGALLASTCCIAPLLLVTLGVSGAWISHLTALAPYKPYFLTLAALLLAGGFWHVYLKPRRACAEGGYCARPASGWITKSILWTGSVLVLLSASVGLWAPWFY